MIAVHCFLARCRAEHPGSQPQGEDSCPDHVHSEQKEGEEKMEEKRRAGL